jgi:uncharacterized protein YrrD
MLRSIKDLEGFAIQATDGLIGHVKDFYFDDEAWGLRYFIVDTGAWLSSRKVLISPMTLDHPNWKERTLSVAITKKQVQNSPDIDTELPVSRQQEMQHTDYYGHRHYWGGGGLRGSNASPNLAAQGLTSVGSQPDDQSEELDIFADIEAVRHRDDDHHLRSCNVVTGYHLEASDGEIGHIEDMLVDEETWAIRFLIVNTSNWWLGHQVLIEPQSIKGVSWSAALVSINLTRQAVKDAPTYEANTYLVG